MASEALNELLNALLPLAQELLKKHGEFYPFGAKMLNDLTIVQVAASDGTEHPTSQVLIDLLNNGLRQEAAAKAIVASGICLDSRFRISADAAAQDAICCRLESLEREAIAIYVPYVVNKGLFSRRTVTYGEIAATAMTSEVFYRQN